MKDILDKVNEGIGGLTTLVMNLLALGILVEVIYGAGFLEWASSATLSN